MRRLLRSGLAICIILLSAVSFVYAAGECNTRCCDEEYPRLVVQGEAKIETMPDKASFKINVRTEEKKLERAFEISTQRINSLSQQLSSNGVKKEDITNLGYVYHPLYEGKKIFTTIDRPSSYEVVYTLKITVYDMGNLGKILSGISEIPETTVYNLEYTSTKLEELKREVLKKAAMDAKEKAAKLAEGSGATLGKVMKIESAAGYYPRESFAEDRLNAFAVKREVEKAVPVIESGSLEIRGNCTVYYSIQ